MSYRVEMAKTGRAGCQATNCKKEKAVIEKGALRQGVLVTIQEHTTMKWRHWGCVTPKVLFNWKESSGLDMELVDGYEELPEDQQEKVKRAIEQCHVDDDDWNGDVEMNRYNAAAPMQGMFKKTPKKKADEASGDEQVEASPTKQKGAKKRGRKDVEDEDEAEPAPKKTKGRAKKSAKTAIEDEPEDAPPATKPKRGKKAKAEAAEDSMEPEAAPTTKKGKAKKAKSTEKVEMTDEDEASALEEAPPPKKSRAKKGTAKSAKVDEEEDDDEIVAPKAVPQKRKGRSTKKSTNHADDD